MAGEKDGARSGLSVTVLDVVIVDDDPDTLDLLQTYLETKNCSVRTARTVRQAIKRVRESIPDAVICDLNLGDTLSGWDLVEALRNHEHTKRVACIAITGRDLTNLRGMFDAYVRKPVELPVLLEVLRRVTDRAA